MLDQFLANAKPKLQRVEIDGVSYHIRPLSGHGRSRYLEFVRNKELFSIGGIVLFGLCNPEGQLLGDPFNADDRARIDDADGALLQQLADVLLESSGLTDRSVKDSEKKSGPSPSESSGTV